MASSVNVSPSVVTAILVLSITIIVSTCSCLLIRYLIRRCGDSALVDDFAVGNGAMVSGSSRSFPSIRRVSPTCEDRALIDSLPLFTFASITSGRNRDCAVCLSNFEPQDELRLLPICCHAFHAQCVDTWIQSNQTKTCPLCRSMIFASEDEILSKVLAASALDSRRSNGSFRIELGNVSRNRQLSTDPGASRRSSTYSLGSFDYVIDAESEVATAATHTREASQDKNDPGSTTTSNNLAAEVGLGGGLGTSRSWLREYVDRLSSRTLSFRSSGRFFAGSDRRNDVAGEYDAGEEISEMFRWCSGV